MKNPIKQSVSNLKQSEFQKKSFEILEGIPLIKLGVYSFVLNLIIIALVLFLKKSLPPVVPLFYGLPVSDKQLAQSTMLTLPSIFSLITVSFNLIIASLLKNTFLQKTLIVAGFATTLLSTITTLKIIFLVGSF